MTSALFRRSRLRLGALAGGMLGLLAAYEQYRGLFGEHPDFVAADRIRDESGCVLRYERTFMRPLLPGDLAT